MPHNVSYPHGFPQSPGAVGSPAPASPNSQYSSSNLPGTVHTPALSCLFNSDRKIRMYFDVLPNGISK